MSKIPKYHFMVGKGGVGKSTLAALLAVTKSCSNNKVLLVSMDPAHNLSDIFNITLSDKVKQYQKNLFLKEIDIEYWQQKYLNKIKMDVEKNYTYLSALNLEGYFDVIKLSPGIEELSLIFAFDHIRKTGGSFDYIIFDMPPTALTLKFFKLPELTIQWLLKLQEIRETILKKRQIISRLKIAGKEIESDKVLLKILDQIEINKSRKDMFTDKSISKINLVLNPEPLAISESHLIKDTLIKLSIELNAVLINKALSGGVGSVGTSFNMLPVHTYPDFQRPITGYQKLMEIIKKHPVNM